MAAATGLTQLHITHQIPFAARPGDKQPAVTLSALIAGIKMKLVTEKCVSIEFDVFYRVAFGAAAGDAESGFSFMAGTAGHPPLHLLHGNAGIGAVCLE